MTKEVLAAQAAALGLDDDMEIERERRENERELRAADAGEEEGEVAAAADPVPKSVLHSTEKQAAQVARRGHRFFRTTLSKSLPAGGGTWLVYELVRAIICSGTMRERVIVHFVHVVVFAPVDAGAVAWQGREFDLEYRVG